MKSPVQVSCAVDQEDPAFFTGGHVQPPVGDGWPVPEAGGESDSGGGRGAPFARSRLAPQGSRRSIPPTELSWVVGSGTSPVAVYQASPGDGLPHDSN